MISTQVSKNLPGARKGERGRSKGNVRGEATARGAVKKSRYVRVFEEEEEVRKDDPIKHFLSRGSELSFESQRG